MGATAQLIAVGPYTPAIEEHLAYRGRYDGVIHGTPVHTFLMPMRTSGTSREMAEALGTHPGDASTWVIQPKNVPEEGSAEEYFLEEILEAGSDGGKPKEEIATLRALLKAGFTVIYDPQD